MTHVVIHDTSSSVAHVKSVTHVVIIDTLLVSCVLFSDTPVTLVMVTSVAPLNEMALSQSLLAN